MQPFSERYWRLHFDRIREWIINAENMKASNVGSMTEKNKMIKEISED